METGLIRKKVLITASTDGIGYEIAKQFLEEGAYVLLNGRNTSKAERKRDILREQYGTDRVFLFVGDAAEKEDLVRMHSYAKSIWNTIDCLVANLGNGKSVSVHRLDTEEWEYSSNINLFSAVKLIKIFEDLWDEKAGGSIVMMSSLAACDRISAPYAYAAAKNGIKVLTKYLSDDYAVRRIRVNCVVPGNVFYAGGRWEELLNQDTDKVRSYIDQNVPLKRFAKPEEVASAVIFLSSERASFITGTALLVDGGQSRGII